MPAVHLSPDGAELVTLLAGVDGGGTAGARRTILGISGAPGSGKSTLARALAGLAPGAVVVPMDGFHLADVELRRRGLLDRKGAPETFDGWGYAALLARLRAEPDHLVMAPEFERDLEQPLAGAIPVLPDCRLVITEGNYLLLDSPEWAAVRSRVDHVWHVRTDDTTRWERLVDRHVRFGKSPEAARAWVDQVDEPNARLVEAAAARADVLLDLTQWHGRVPEPFGEYDAEGTRPR